MAMHAYYFPSRRHTTMPPKKKNVGRAASPGPVSIDTDSTQDQPRTAPKPVVHPDGEPAAAAAAAGGGDDEPSAIDPAGVPAEKDTSEKMFMKKSRLVKNKAPPKGKTQPPSQSVAHVANKVCFLATFGHKTTLALSLCMQLGDMQNFLRTEAGKLALHVAGQVLGSFRDLPPLVALIGGHGRPQDLQAFKRYFVLDAPVISNDVDVSHADFRLAVEQAVATTEVNSQFSEYVTRTGGGGVGGRCNFFVFCSVIVKHLRTTERNRFGASLGYGWPKRLIQTLPAHKVVLDQLAAAIEGGTLPVKASPLPAADEAGGVVVPDIKLILYLGTWQAVTLFFSLFFEEYGGWPLLLA